MERVQRKLAGADDGNRQMVDILTAVLTDGLPAVEAACAEAITHHLDPGQQQGIPMARRLPPQSGCQPEKLPRNLPPVLPKTPEQAKSLSAFFSGGGNSCFGRLTL